MASRLSGIYVVVGLPTVCLFSFLKSDPSSRILNKSLRILDWFCIFYCPFVCVFSVQAARRHFLCSSANLLQHLCGRPKFLLRKLEALEFACVIIDRRWKVLNADEIVNLIRSSIVPHEQVQNTQFLGPFQTSRHCRAELNSAIKFDCGTTFETN